MEVDGTTFAAVIAGIDFTAARRGWFRAPRARGGSTAAPRYDLSSLVLDVAALQEENAALRAQVTQLIETVARLNERVGELLAVAQRKQRKPSPPEPPPAVEGDAKLAFEARPKPPEPPPKTKSKGPRPPPTGRKPLPSHLPVGVDGDRRHWPQGPHPRLARGAQRLHRTLQEPHLRRLPVRGRQGQRAPRREGHGLRKFRDAEDTQPTLGAEDHGFISAMYLEEARAQKLGLVGEALVEHRRHLIRPLADQLDRWCDAVAPTLLPSEPLMAAVGYYQRHKKALFRFIDNSNVPIDNSATEREFQNVAKLRLNVLFAGSTEGAHRACVLLGIIATCRTVGVPLQAYLTWAFERLGTHRDVFGLPIEEMTPAGFKTTLP